MKNLGILLLLACMLSTSTAVHAQKTWVKSNKRKTTSSLANPTKDPNYSPEKAAEMSRKADEEARQKAIQDSIEKAEYAAIPEGLFWEPSQRKYIGEMESGYYKLYEFYNNSEHSYGGSGTWILTPQLQTNLATGDIKLIFWMRIKIKSAFTNASVGAFIVDSEIDDCIKALKLMKNVTKFRGDGRESKISFRSGNTIAFDMTDTGKGWKLRFAISDDATYDHTQYNYSALGKLTNANTTKKAESYGMDIPLDKIDEFIDEFQKAKDLLTEAKRKKTAK